MRGGLDDALDKLARREEVLRRRSNGEPAGTPPAVTELVEAIAGVVARHPQLGVTVGAEGAGEPLLLHFFFAEGQVQVTADTPVRHAEPAAAARHAEVVDVGPSEPAVDDQRRYSAPPAPAGYAYAEPEEPYYGDSDTAERRYGSFDSPPSGYQDSGEPSRDLGARLRDLGMAGRTPPPPPPPPQYPPHPFAATPPPPVPTSAGPDTSSQATRRIQAEQHRAPAEPAAADRTAPQQRGGMPAPLPKPIPLQVERPEETEMAARRLAALLRDDPGLLSQSPPD